MRLFPFPAVFSPTCKRSKDPHTVSRTASLKTVTITTMTYCVRCNFFCVLPFHHSLTHHFHAGLTAPCRLFVRSVRNGPQFCFVTFPMISPYHCFCHILKRQLIHDQQIHFCCHVLLDVLSVHVCVFFIFCFFLLSPLSSSAA